MTNKELICKLEKFSDDDCILLSDSDGGWANLDKVILDGNCIMLVMEKYPLFSKG